MTWSQGTPAIPLPSARLQIKPYLQTIQGICAGYKRIKEFELLFAAETGCSLLFSSQIKQANWASQTDPVEHTESKRAAVAELKPWHRPPLKKKKIENLKKVGGWGFFEGWGVEERRRNSCFAIGLSLRCYDYKLIYTEYLYGAFCSPDKLNSCGVIMASTYLSMGTRYHTTLLSVW